MKMVLKKQTIWLLTMLSLMVVLSAYYLYNPPLDGANQTAGNEVETNTEMLGDDHDWIDVLGQYDSDFSYFRPGEENQATESDIEYFLDLQIDRDRQRAEQLERFDQVMSNKDSTIAVISEAKQQFDYLQELTHTEEELESQIRSLGFAEAVVMTGDNKVNVLVSSADDIGKETVVNIIHLVQEHIDLPGYQVMVSYK